MSHFDSLRICREPQPIGVLSQGDVLFNTLQHIIRS
jgi:hypothetical protein